MPVETKTVGSPAAVLAGRADMTKNGYTQEQLVKNSNGRIVLKSRSESSVNRGENKALTLWRNCVTETRREGDPVIPKKGSEHYNRAREMYDKKNKAAEAPQSGGGGWFS